MGRSRVLRGARIGACPDAQKTPRPMAWNSLWFD
jgi:hypothetical protein